MTRRPVRVGVIGTGGIARTHLEGYRSAGVDIVALCDVDAIVLAERQQSWEVAAGYTDYHDLLADPDVDAVSVCTPNATHHAITLDAARSGKHVL